jgi:hypothetical protein
MDKTISSLIMNTNPINALHWFIIIILSVLLFAFLFIAGLGAVTGGGQLDTFMKIVHIPYYLMNVRAISQSFPWVQSNVGSLILFLLWPLSLVTTIYSLFKRNLQPIAVTWVLRIICILFILSAILARILS